MISACHKAEISLPDDIAILGGGYDELLSDVSQPSLSGIVTPARQIGHKAAEILHSILKVEAAPLRKALMNNLDLL